MRLEENPYQGNNNVSFTTSEFEKFKSLEELVQRNNGRLTEIIIKTAKDVLELIVNSESLVVEKNNIKYEIVLPQSLTNRDYVNPIKIEPLLKEEDSYGPHLHEVDLEQSEFDALVSLKELYNKALSKKFKDAVVNEDFMDIDLIFEIGLNYINGLVKISQEGYKTIEIVDKNRVKTSKVLNAEEVLVKVKTEKERYLDYEAGLKQAIDIMRQTLSGDINNIEVYRNSDSADMKLVIERQKKRKAIEEMKFFTYKEIQRLPLFWKECPDNNIEKRKQKEKGI